MPLTKVKSGGVSDSITLTSPDINAPDIDGGTIDNAVIGGSTAAAGSFTTITATGGNSSNWNTAYGWGDHSTQSYATQTYVGTAVSNLVDSSPAALDTLNELAAALGDDPNFATTVTNSIALKAPLANPSFTGSVNTEAVSTNSLDLQAIAESKSVTAVDVFVYDTSKDSDGGAWRKRTQHTSWYNETLNTSTRGATKKFPSVAVIVSESAKVTIYDGDDPDMPMWMVFNKHIPGFIYTTVTCAEMLNGILIIGVNPGNANYYDAGVKVVGFLSDTLKSYSYALGLDYHKPVSERNMTSTTGLSTEVSQQLVNPNVNDVAMTVLPNAPIDADTGLPVPTLAVATNGGVSVIKDDGTIVNFTGATNYEITGLIQFTADNRLRFCMDSGNNRFLRTFNIPSADRVVNQWDGSYDDGLTAYLNYGSSGDIRIPNYINTIAENSLAGAWGFTHYEENLSDPTKSLAVEISSTYNTGYVVGQSILATLSDTDTTNVTDVNLISNGDFSSSAGWIIQAGWAISSGVATCDGTNGAYIYQVADMPVNTQVAVSLDITSYTSGSVRIGSTGVTDIAVSGVGTHTATFKTRTSGASGVEFYSNSFVGTIDNVSVTLAEPDRSVNGNGLQVFGTVTKTAVATGADLVAYSGFSTSNYLQQPYNSDLDFGTGDFCVMGWMQGTSTNASQRQYIMSRGNGTTQLQVIREYTGKFQFHMGNDYIQTAGADYKVGDFHFAFVRRSGDSYIYVNGVLDATGTTPDSVTTSEPLFIGIDSGLNASNWSMKDSIALLRISATVPTAEQIAKMYNDEKHLFQEGAQATLYGTSDAVTALAYDDDTELLHAGTSAGRSVFQGLRRVENTTDAVGSAISASNGLVAED